MKPASPAQLARKFAAIRTRSEQLQTLTLQLKQSDGDLFDNLEGQANDITEACGLAMEMIQRAQEQAHA